MRCPICTKDGTLSTVCPLGSMSTLMGFSPGHYDEDGKWVAHPDPNYHTTDYVCSNDHRFDVVRREGHPDRVRVKGAGAGPCYDAPEDAALNVRAPKSGDTEGA